MFTYDERVTGKLFIKEERVVKRYLKFFTGMGYESAPIIKELRMPKELMEGIYKLLIDYDKRVSDRISELDDIVKVNK